MMSLKGQCTHQQWNKSEEQILAKCLCHTWSSRLCGDETIDRSIMLPFLKYHGKSTGSAPNHWNVFSIFSVIEMGPHRSLASRASWTIFCNCFAETSEGFLPPRRPHSSWETTFALVGCEELDNFAALVSCNGTSFDSWCSCSESTISEALRFSDVEAAAASVNLVVRLLVFGDDGLDRITLNLRAAFGFDVEFDFFMLPILWPHAKSNEWLNSPADQLVVVQGSERDSSLTCSRWLVDRVSGLTRLHFLNQDREQSIQSAARRHISEFLITVNVNVKIQIYCHMPYVYVLLSSCAYHVNVYVHKRNIFTVDCTQTIPIHWMPECMNANFHDCWLHHCITNWYRIPAWIVNYQ